MRKATEEKVECDTATTTSEYRPTVTPDVFYKTCRSRAVPAKVVASVHNFRQPKLEILQLEEEQIAQPPDVKTAHNILETDNSSIFFHSHSSVSNPNPSRHLAEQDAAKVELPESLTLEGLDLEGIDLDFNIEDNAQLVNQIHEDIISMSPYSSAPESPLLFPDSSPSKKKLPAPLQTSSGLVVLPKCLSYPSSATATIVSPPNSSKDTEAAHTHQPEAIVKQSSPATGNRRSKIWEHFVTVGDGRMVKCKLCGREVSRGRDIAHLTNAGMNYHFRAHHTPVLLREESGVAAPPSKKRGSSNTTAAINPKRLNKGQEDEGTSCVVDTCRPIPLQQPTLQQFPSFQSRGMSRQQSLKITRLIGELIAVGGAPFNIVEGHTFKNLMKVVAPHYVLPCRTTFSRKIVPSLYNSCVGLLKEELGRAAGQSVHFTTDLWSAPSGQHAFLSLTAHWWQPKESQPNKPKAGMRSTGAKAAEPPEHGQRTFLLHAEVMDDQHTAVNILRALQKMVAQWLGEESGTRAKMGFIVTDAAANMLKAVRDGRFVGIRCSAHALHLVVKSALDDESETSKLSAILDSCRKIAAHFHRSVKDSHILRLEQSKACVPQHRLKVDVATRWNSTLEMLERIMEQQKPIHAMSNEHVIGVARPISREEWKIISQVVAVLSHFRDVTEKLSLENASLAQVIPLYIYLITKMDGFLNKSEPLPGGIVQDVAAIIKRLRGQLNRRMNELIEACPELMLASMCDPRIKGKMAIIQSSLTTYRDLLIQRVFDSHRKLFRPAEGEEEEDQEEPDSDIVPPSPTVISTTTAEHSTRRPDVWSLALHTLVGPTKMPTMKRSIVSDHVKLYLSEPHLASTTDPLEYWDEKRGIWPALSVVAQELLSCPPTSVQSERVFSITGNILCPQRSQLAPQLMEQMAFLKVNLPKLGYPELSFTTE